MDDKGALIELQIGQSTLIKSFEDKELESATGPYGDAIGRREVSELKSIIDQKRFEKPSRDRTLVAQEIEQELSLPVGARSCSVGNRA